MIKRKKTCPRVRHQDPRSELDRDNGAPRKRCCTNGNESLGGGGGGVQQILGGDEGEGGGGGGGVGGGGETHQALTVQAEMKAYFEMRLNRVEGSNRFLAQENSLLRAAMDASKKLCRIETRLLLTKGESDGNMASTLRALEQNLVSLTSLRPVSYSSEPPQCPTTVTSNISSQLAAAIAMSQNPDVSQAALPPLGTGNDAASMLASMCMRLGPPGSMPEPMPTGGVGASHSFSLPPAHTPKIESGSSPDGGSSFATSIMGAAFIGQFKPDTRPEPGVAQVHCGSGAQMTIESGKDLLKMASQRGLLMQNSGLRSCFLPSPSPRT
jgi:hypothetical protein